MRTLCGIGKPKTLQDLSGGLLALLQGLWRALERALRPCTLARGSDLDIRVHLITAAA